MNSSEFKTLITSQLKNPLPGQRAHTLLAPTGRLIDFALIPDKGSYKKSAVALILFSQSNELNFVLIERQTYNGAHSGQIAFPGGKYEDRDIHLEKTARRETLEEIGISLDDSHLIGKLSEVFIPVSKFVVHPYLYFMEELPPYQLDPREVQNILIQSVSELQIEDAIRYTSIPLSDKETLNNVPHFSLSEKIVWGATALILSEFRELLNTSNII